MRILVATTWHPLDGMPTYCTFTQRMVEASRAAGLDVQLVRPVPWFRWFLQRRRVANGGLDRYPISWKPYPRASDHSDAIHHARAVLRAIRGSGGSFSLVHTHGLDANLSMGAFLSSELGVPWVLHAHDTTLPTDGETRVGIAKASRIFAVSQHQKRLLAEAYPHIAGRIRVLYNGVPSSFFEAAGRKAAGAGLNAVYVGRLHPNKGLDWLLLRWKELTAVADHLDIYGAGPQEMELRRIASAQGLGQAVRFCGEASNATLPSILPNYDVFLSPTRLETFGIANVEALASGIPILVSDLPITREVLGGCNGVFFHGLEDAQSFRLALDVVRRAPPSSVDIRSSVGKYRLERTAEELKGHYVEALEDKGSLNRHDPSKEDALHGS